MNGDNPEGECPGPKETGPLDGTRLEKKMRRPQAAIVKLATSDQVSATQHNIGPQITPHTLGPLFLKIARLATLKVEFGIESLPVSFERGELKLRVAG